MNVDKIVEVVNSSGLVISPTDTVYGIMGDALNEDVIRRVYSAKKRSYSKPLILLMSNIDMIKEYTECISDEEEKLINKFLPGLMTVILKKNEKISSLICNGGDYVGIRIPDNKDLIDIINKLGRPVISTSANISDNDVITRVDMIEEELLKNIDYVEDGGEIVSLSSSVVRVVDGELIILREGKISDEIKAYYMANLKK